MRGVRKPAGQPALIRTLAAAAGALACAAVLGACGGSSDERAERPAAPERPAGLPADFNLQVFDCEGWNKASEPVRRYVIRRLHELSNDQITGPTVEGRGSVLTDAEAYQLFESSCASRRARGFVLYKLYAYARGFRGRGPEAAG